MSEQIAYVLCRCPEHGAVCAKRTGIYEGGSPDPRFYYQCPGVEGDTGGCFAGLSPLGPECDRPEWAEYPDEHVAE
jgi:hypothetical protein